MTAAVDQFEVFANDTDTLTITSSGIVPTATATVQAKNLRTLAVTTVPCVGLGVGSCELPLAPLLAGNTGNVYEARLVVVDGTERATYTLTFSRRPRLRVLAAL